MTERDVIRLNVVHSARMIHAFATVDAIVKHRHRQLSIRRVEKQFASAAHVTTVRVGNQESRGGVRKQPVEH